MCNTNLLKKLFRVVSKLSNSPFTYYGEEPEGYYDGTTITWYVAARKEPLATSEGHGMQSCDTHELEYYSEHFTEQEARLLVEYLEKDLDCSSSIFSAKPYSENWEEHNTCPLRRGPWSRLVPDGYRDFSYDLTQEPSYRLPFKVYGHFGNQGCLRPKKPADIIVRHRPDEPDSDDRKHWDESDWKCGCCGEATKLGYFCQLFFSTPFSNRPICDKCAEKHFPEKYALVVASNRHPVEIHKELRDYPEDERVGACPHCAMCDGKVFDGQAVWAFCGTHKLKWSVSDGHIVMKSKDENSLEYAFRNLLVDYQEATPVYLAEEDSKAASPSAEDSKPVKAAEA